jgi:membrane protease subunit HflC
MKRSEQIVSLENVEHPSASIVQRRSRRARRLLLLVASIVAVVLVSASMFTVDVTEYALVIRFGAPLRSVQAPGLYLKAPFDTIVRLDKRLTFSRPGKAEYLTVDKHNVVLESLATWRILDPDLYYRRLRDRAEAEVRLADVVLSEIGGVLGSTAVADLIAADGDSARYRRSIAEIKRRVATRAAARYGIGVADVELLQLTLPEQNRTHVFDRMKAERDKMAKEYRTIGALYARKIIAEADHERTRIEAESHAQASRIRAEGDAEAARIYAKAFARDQGFYKFLRTLEAYGKILDENTTLFLPAGAEVFRVLRSGQQLELEAQTAPSTTARTPRSARDAALSLSTDDAPAESVGSARPR